MDKSAYVNQSRAVQKLLGSRAVAKSVAPLRYVEWLLGTDKITMHLAKLVPIYATHVTVAHKLAMHGQTE